MPRRRAIVPLLALALLVGASEAGRAAKEAPAVRVLFVGPGSGPDALVSAEARFGLESAGGAALPAPLDDAPRVELDVAALPEPGKPLAEAVKAWRKAGPALVVAWLPDGRTPEFEEALSKAKLPLLVLSPEPTRPSLDPARGVFWAGGVPPLDEAQQALDYALMPLGSRRPAILHDGGARGAQAAAAAAFFAHTLQTPGAPTEVGPAFDAAAVAGLAATQTDAVVYFGGPEGANRLLRALAEAHSELPVLLGQGLASPAVPAFADGSAARAWSLEPAWFDDQGLQGAAERAPLDAAAAAAGRRTYGATVRAHRAMLWLRRALRDAEDPSPRRLVPALRAVARPAAAGKPVFSDDGHATLARCALWRAPAVEGRAACSEVPETRSPMRAVPTIGCYTTSRFRWEPGTFHVWVHYAEGAKRTIDQDLLAIGLSTGGYEEALEDRILDDLRGRVISRLNRLFLRNPDGSAVPGVSYAVSFSPDPPPDDARPGRRFEVIIGGDHPSAGGEAYGTTAAVYSTFIQRTMYVERKLDPPVSAADRPHMTGAYRWDTSAPDNIRNGLVRALLDGFSQALALTAAHEIGHLTGCGHDTESPRSIMNVVEGGGLDFDWAEWTPGHAATIERRFGRVPAAR